MYIDTKNKHDIAKKKIDYWRFSFKKYGVYSKATDMHAFLHLRILRLRKCTRFYICLFSGYGNARICVYRLFTYVNEALYFNKPTYAAFIALLDNYNHVVGGAEHSTAEETREITSFLNEITKTTVMQKAQTFLAQNGKISELDLPVI